MPLTRKNQRSRDKEVSIYYMMGDFFTESDLITELNWDSFTDFTQNKDVALVLFYDGQQPESYTAKKNVEKAASKTKRENSGYAGVNCINQSDVCQQMGVKCLPSFMVFSRGNLVSTIRDTSNFTADMIHKYVEMCPILESPRVDVFPGLSAQDVVKPIWPKKEEKESVLSKFLKRI